MTLLGLQHAAQEVEIVQPAFGPQKVAVKDESLLISVEVARTFFTTQDEFGMQGS